MYCSTCGRFLFVMRIVSVLPLKLKLSDVAGELYAYFHNTNEQKKLKLRAEYAEGPMKKGMTLLNVKMSGSGRF